MGNARLICVWIMQRFTPKKIASSAKALEFAEVTCRDQALRWHHLSKSSSGPANLSNCQWQGPIGAAALALQTGG